MKPVYVSLIGFGQIGQMLFRKWSALPQIRVIAVTDPAYAGQDACKIAGAAGEEMIIQPELKTPAEVAVIATSSYPEDVLPLIQKCVALDMSVVTTCEELFYDRCDEVRRIAKDAEMRGIAVLAGGINPGYLMDFLPAILSGASMNVRSVTVERYQDASNRRTQFQRKIGAGLTMPEFEAAVNAGTLRHAGLMQSMKFLADVFGWELASMTEEFSPVTDDGIHIRGVRQLGSGKLADGREVITLDFLAAVGEPEPRDRIVIDGDPRLESCIKGGLNGDAGTCAVMTSLVRRVAACGQSGFLTMRDLPLFSGNGV
ncbi:MAG: hypothetical protein IKD46_01805 [Lentisphaeria bacterium]|nr:hypothetical protein [Lentisphaeria bacterium]MBR2641840.1 hypothetical protein [Lentisphaeria bacterium]